MLFRIRRHAGAHAPRRRAATSPRSPAGTPLFPLIVLFGLNAVDELDRTVFGVLGPEIRDTFGLDNQGYLTLDRAHAARRAAPRGAARLLRRPDAARAASRSAAPPCGRVFGAAHRAGRRCCSCSSSRGPAPGWAGRWSTPTHNSLLADYYPIEKRTEVYGFHRMANAVGAFVGPLVGGLLAEAYGWRVPFIVFVIPTLVFVVLGMQAEGARTRALRARGGGRDAPR